MALYKVRNRVRITGILSAVCGFVLISLPCLGAIPLITDDTGTQGRGKFQIEVLGEYQRDSESNGPTEPWLESQQNGVTASLAWGMGESVDLIVSVPFQWVRTSDGGASQTSRGLSDIAVEMKWRFFESHGFSLAVKPGLVLPSGDWKRGLGSGKPACSFYLIGSKEWGRWSFHSNLSYIRNENKNDERNDIWQGSAAALFALTEQVRFVGDVGAGSNPDRSSRVAPAYALGGIIYSPSPGVDFGLGIKGGLTKPEADLAVRGGVTWRF